MKLLKQFFFLTVCGLMTVRGVVAMEEAQGGGINEPAVVAPEKQPADGVREASVPVGVLSEEQRTFLRSEIVGLHGQRTNLFEGSFEHGLIEHYYDAILFLQYINEVLFYAAHVLNNLPKPETFEVSERLEKMAHIRHKQEVFLRETLNKLHAEACKIQDKKLAFKENESLDNDPFVGHLNCFVRALNDFSVYYEGSETEFSQFVSNDILKGLRNLVTTAFVDGVRSRSIIRQINYLLTLCVETFNIKQVSIPV